MKKILLVCLLSFLICNVKAQNDPKNVSDESIAMPIKNKPKHEVSFDLLTFYTPLLSQDFYGGSLDLKYYPLKKYATGLDFSLTQKRIENTFSYSMEKPLIQYYEFSWVNQYDIIQSDKFRLGLNLNNGIGVSRLGDNAIKEEYLTRYGYVEKPKEIATNYYYLLEPGLDISIRLFSKNHYPDFYLTTKAKYRFAFGDSNYGQPAQFSNYYLGIGVSLIGFAE